MPSPLSSRPERGAVEGSAVSLSGSHADSKPHEVHQRQQVPRRDLLFALRLRPVISGNELSFVADEQQGRTAIFELAGEVLPAAHIMESNRFLV
jgi:hypothetical protein